MMLNHGEMNIVVLRNGLFLYVIMLVEMHLELRYITLTLPIQKIMG